MAANASKVTQQYDAAAAALFRADGSVAITATGKTLPVNLNELRTAYWHNFEIPNGKFVVGMAIEACASGGADETYSVAVRVDDDSSMAASTTIDTFTIPRGTTGFLSRIYDSKDIPILDTDHSSTGKWMDLNLTLGGASPSITFSAWLGKCLGE